MPESSKFEIQDSADNIDLVSSAKQSTSLLSGVKPRRGFLFFCIGCIGVLAVVAATVAILATTSDKNVKSDSIKKLVDHPSDILDELEPQFFRSNQDFDTIPEIALPGDCICETAGCLESAATLLEAINPDVDPCEDFYEFACGNWYDSHPVTNESLGTFNSLDALVADQLSYIMLNESLVSDPLPVRDIRTNYLTCLDTDTMDSLGLTPLWSQLSASGQGGWPIAMDSWDDSHFTIYEALVLIQRIGVNPMISVGISADFKDTSTNILYVSEGDLGLDPKFLRHRSSYPTQLDSYHQFIVNSAMLVRESIGSSVTDEQIEADAQEIIDFESNLANIFTYTPFDISDIIMKADVNTLQKITDAHVENQFDWQTYFHVMFQETALQINETEPLYITSEPFYSLWSLLLYQTSERLWANYIGWRWVQETGSATTYEMRALVDDFNLEVNNVSSSTSRESLCVTQTQFNLAMPTSRAYIDQYFDTTSRPEIYEMIENLRSAFDSLLLNNTWMDPDDIDVAREKLDAIYDRVAYPDWIMNDDDITLAYNGLDIIEGEQYDNLMRMAEFYDYWNLDSFRLEPVIGWSLPPTVVNAFYDPLSNSITILAAILQHPFFTVGSLAATNYGGIGMVIGHEMTHGFDNLGRRFDSDGNLVSWWTQDSIDGFNERAQCFVNQYNQYSPPEFQGTDNENLTVNGQQTLGENIADNGGIREAFLAYNSYVETYGQEKSLPGLEDYTSQQIFFLSFAKLWCEHRTYDALENQIETDPHSPGRFRIIGSLSNDPDFRETFGCSRTDDMNRGSDSCLMW